MRQLTWTAITIGLALGGTARADDREAAALATKLARMQMPKEQFEQSLTAVFSQMQEAVAEQAVATGKHAPPDFTTRRSAVMREILSYDEMMDLTAGVWMKRFTVDELKALVRFYESPLGRKLAKKQPEIARDSMGTMMPLILQRMPKVMEKLRIAEPAAR
jgi:hypothetical protein